MSQSQKDIKPNPTYTEVRSPDVEWTKYRSKEYWEYRKNWSEYPKNLHVSDFPLHLDIETTSFCNLECTMCPRTIQKNKGVDYLEKDLEGATVFPLDLYKKIIDEGSENGLCSIKFQYLSEPLSDPHIVERVRYAKEKGIIDTMFNTNATLLDEEMSYKILEAGIDDIFFSVDSIVPDKYNKIRVGAEYQQVVENIKNFMKIKKENGYKKVQTRVSMVVLPGTPEKEVEAYQNFWLPIVGIVGFDEWVNHSLSRGEYQDYNPNFICAQPFQRIIITYDGICTPCCADDVRAYSIGDVKKNTIKEIWHGEKLQKLRDAHINSRYTDIDICKTCFAPFSKSNGATPDIIPDF